MAIRRRLPDLIELDAMLVTVLLGLELLLYFFWQVTQYPAVSGSWWSALFSRSGPVLLPIMFAVELAIFAAAVPLAWRRRGSIRQTPAALFLIGAVAVGCLTIPLAFLNHFDHTKIWKDVAFLLGYLTLPTVLVLGRRTARNFFFYYLVLALAAGALELAEAFRRSAAIHESFGHFLLNTYRIYAGGHYQELLLVFGFLVVVAAYGRAISRLIWVPMVAVFVYLDMRFRVYFTRLYWIALAFTWAVFVFWVLPRRLWRGALVLTVLTAALFIGIGFGAGALSNGADLADRFKAPQDVSVTFRVVESKILLRLVLRRPLTGWGPGGTISPNDPLEPKRNNTSSFFDGYLGIPYKFGVFVFLAIVGGVVAAIWQVRRSLRSTVPALEAAIVAGATAYLIGILAASPASDLLFANFSALPVGLMAGIATRLTLREPLTAASASRQVSGRDASVNG